MRVMRRLKLLSLLAVAILFVQNASATLEPILPESSYHEGFVFYGDEPDYEGHLKGRIDFAVYDTDNLLLPDETALADELGLPGRYIYAYEIFNDYEGTSEESVAYFAVFNPDETAMELDEESIGSHDDEMGGIEPANAYLTGSKSRVVWEFNGGSGYVIAGEHSWFLVFSSDQDWIAGDYEVKGPQDVPVPSPEPATIVLLGVGGALMMCTKRRKSV